MAYLIGDTVRLKATIKNLSGNESAPDSITVSVLKNDGSTVLLDTATPTKVDGSTAQYYYDWQISTSLTESERLIALWEWSGNQKKSMRFMVQLKTEYAS